MEITEVGAAAPAFVLGSARRPRISLARDDDPDLQKGTVLTSRRPHGRRPAGRRLRRHQRQRRQGDAPFGTSSTSTTRS